MRSRPHADVPGEGRFHKIVAAFLTQPGLAFARVLSAERVERVFAEHGNLFGQDAIYSTVLTLWAFLGQALREGKQASCQAAVAETTRQPGTEHTQPAQQQRKKKGPSNGPLVLAQAGPQAKLACANSQFTRLLKKVSTNFWRRLR